MSSKRRTTIAAFIVMAVAAPAGFAIAQAADGGGETMTAADGTSVTPDNAVPASQCPEAVAQLRQAGITQQFDEFYPDCPTAAQIQETIADNAEALATSAKDGGR